jgi:hypothetical protein
MPANLDEIKKRETVARGAIKHAFETDEGEDSVRLFVSHHLAELDRSYWKRHLSTESPEPSVVVDLLQLRSHWGGPDAIETFDFTLPDDVTNYVLCVRFDDEGAVSEIAMES